MNIFKNLKILFFINFIGALSLVNVIGNKYINFNNHPLENNLQQWKPFLTNQKSKNAEINASCTLSNNTLFVGGDNL